MTNMSTQQDEIIEAIKNGMKDACDDMHHFTDKPEREFNAEYLFTVATAKAINRYNMFPAEKFEIRIEHNTAKFAKHCLPLINYGNPMVKGSSIFRGKVVPKINRSGRIDIAIYSEKLTIKTMGKVPLCAIELKGFNPSRILVLEDLRRNLEFIRIREKIGEGYLDFTAFAALHKTRVPQDEEQAKAEQVLIQNKYKKWMSELGVCNDINIKIEAFTVSWIPHGTIEDEGDEQVIYTKSRHNFIGVIVIFSKIQLINCCSYK